MGYTTEFEGRFEFNKPLDDDTYELVRGLSETRRMKRDVDPAYGIEGEFYIEGTGPAGQGREANIIDNNCPPSPQPGLWLKWVPTEDREYLEWDGGEKFYFYVEWLEYLIDTIFEPQAYLLNGIVSYSGEEAEDYGRIIIEDNIVTVENKETRKQQEAALDELIRLNPMTAIVSGNTWLRKRAEKYCKENGIIPEDEVQKTWTSWLEGPKAADIRVALSKWAVERDLEYVEKVVDSIGFFREYVAFEITGPTKSVDEFQQRYYQALEDHNRR